MTSEFDEELEHLRAACNDLTLPIEALAGRGAEPPEEPRTPGEIAHFVLTLKRSTNFRPRGWEDRCLDWVRNGRPYVRQFVLVNTPLPLPAALLTPYRQCVRQTIAATIDMPSLHDGVQRAVELGVPVDELLAILVDRLGPEPPYLYRNLYSCLEDLLKTGKHDCKGGTCVATPNNNEMAAIKQAWKRFLAEQGMDIRNGKRFDPKWPEARGLFGTR
jgi:hypothetical protein